ncbi:hypothetical protein [Brevibacillus dissolubilis]|uniref:hypothetical protein n=1 Tax=Brevibacillus dissolubilis TaxID=1844116 RepID=UPI00111684AB|nr:hypothetical protein [Brevibacillus dissolubilis]
MLKYAYDTNLIEISETRNEEDVTFLIEVKSEEMRSRLKQVRAYFENNDDFTDAMFYSRKGAHYEVIVQNDHYTEFLTQAFLYKCLESLAWE